MMPNGKSFMTTAGAQESLIWLHDDKTGEKQVRVFRQTRADRVSGHSNFAEDHEYQRRRQAARSRSRILASCSCTAFRITRTGLSWA